MINVFSLMLFDEGEKLMCYSGACMYVANVL